MTEKEFDTIDVLAVAVAAYEMNNNEYVKSKEVRANETDTLCFHYITYYANKEIIRMYFCPEQFVNKGNKDIPKVPKVTDEHKKIAEDVKKYSNRIVFKILGKEVKKNNDDFFGISGSSNDNYLENLYKIINKEKVSEHDFGIIASSLTYYYNEKEKEKEREKMSAVKNDHVGIIGNKIYLDNFEVIKIIPSKKFGGVVVKGIADENLFLYYSSNPVNFKSGDILKITGKIKKHETDNNFNVSVTCLNYVKYN